jgi:putative oxidoreductase
MDPVRIVAVGGRALLAMLFILAGLAKLAGPQPFLQHMAAFGVPTFLLPAVIALEVGAGAALLLGWRLRDAAAALGLFCLLTAFVFHHDLGDKAERTLFFKDVALAGALLAMAAAVEQRRRAEQGRAVPSPAKPS